MLSRRNFLQLALSSPAVAGIASSLLEGRVVGQQYERHPADLAMIRRGLIRVLVGSERDAVQRAGTRLASPLTAEGTWPDIDYQDRSRNVWKSSVHLLYTLQMAGACGTGNRETRERLLPRVTAALQWWLDHDLRNPNWWWNEIGAPRLLGEIALFLDDALPDAFRPSIEKTLRRADWTKWTGQNLVWGCQIQVLRGLLTAERATVGRALQRLYEEIAFASPRAEGIMPDLSFHQHGPQLYSGGYGLNFAAEAGAYLMAAWGTGFEISHDRLDTYTRYVLDGEAQMIRGSIFDYAACGREITRKGKDLDWRGGIDVSASQAPLSGGVNLIEAVEALGGMSVPRANEFAAVAARIRGSASTRLFSINRHFWCSDYMVHHRPAFFTSIRMCSERTVNTELVNEEGKRSHHLADGCTFIYRDGREYRDIFPVWDWSKVPGTTAQQIDLLHAPGPTYKTDATFVGGVSDGTYGAAAQELHRDELRARKAWFLFDEGFVALGTDIACHAQHSVVTSVNQCLLRGKAERLGNSVWHDNVAYIPLGRTSFEMTSGAQTGRWSDIGTGPDEAITLDVFNVWIDHGVGPRDAGYAYLVAPGVTNRLSYAQTQSIVRVLSNTRQLQAVHIRKTGMVLAVFWSAGSLEVAGHGLEPDVPCLLMAQETRGRLLLCVSNPENQPATVTLTTSLRAKGPGAVPTGKGSRVRIELPDGAMAGKSVRASYDIG